MTDKVVIEVRGGVVTNVVSSLENLEIELIDWDGAAGGDTQEQIDERNARYDRLQAQIKNKEMFERSV